MRCTNCGYENRAGTRFCNECADPLSLRCPHVWDRESTQCTIPRWVRHPFTGRDAAKWRNGQTGKWREEQHLTRNLDPRPQTLASSRLEAERRRLTVMFCDLVASAVLPVKPNDEGGNR
jgi:hypothetical protein